MNERWLQFCELNGIYTKYRACELNDKVKDSHKEFIEAWVASPKCSVMLQGLQGRGKTWALSYMMRRIVERVAIGHVRYFNSKDLDDRCLEELKKYGTNSYFLRQVYEVPFLFIDDFGTDRATDRNVSDWYTIIDKRTGWERPTVLSTNLDDKEIVEYYGKRIASRLSECQGLVFEGLDLRGIR